VTVNANPELFNILFKALKKSLNFFYSPEGLEKFGILLEVIEHPVDGLICATQGLSVIFTVGIRTGNFHTIDT